MLLPLPTGALTLSQLDLLFRALPFDVTYVDENDRVRFYSEGERVFPRSPGAIGREVRNCHPPKSLHKVEEILSAFKAGTKDDAEFWIEMGPKFVHIRYFALRDAERRVQGLPRGRPRRDARAFAVGQPQDRRLVGDGAAVTGGPRRGRSRRSCGTRDRSSGWRPESYQRSSCRMSSIGLRLRGSGRLTGCPSVTTATT